MSGVTSFTSVPIIGISSCRHPAPSSTAATARLSRAAAEVGLIHQQHRHRRSLFGVMLAAVKEYFARCR